MLDKPVYKMWQRIQTLYLAISTILIATLLFSTKAVSLNGDGSIAEQIKYTSYLPYLVLTVIVLALNVLALTTYKHRIFQMRTAGLSSIITLALQIWLVVDFVATHNDVVFKLTAIFPLITIILNVLAMRGILADQLLVESAYSLRKSRRERRRSK